jgi:EmrB/QacA subfamily drug resistance transporter
MDQRVAAVPRTEAAFVPPPGFNVTLFCLMLALFLGALNQTIVAAALPTIGKAFGDVGNLSWVISAYFLFGTAVAPILGKLSDIYGRRPLMLLSIGMFVAGSLVCALAPNMLTLIVGRALQGLGGGGLFPMVHSTINDLIPPSERGKYFIFNSLTWTTASLAGPILGGVLAEYLNWSVIFWLNVPLGAAAMLLLAQRLKGLPKPDVDRHFDAIGGALLMASAVVFLLCVSWGGVRYSWSSPTILALAAGTVALVVMYVVRARHVDEPFLPLSALRGSVVPWGIMGGSFALASTTGLVALLPLYFQIVHKLSAADAGLALVPFVISNVPGTFLASRALKRPTYKWYPVVGLILSTVTLALIALIGHSLSFVWLIALLTIAGIGYGPTFPISTIAVQNAVASHQVGLVTSASHYFRFLTSATAVAVGGSALLLGLGFSPFAPGADRMLFEVPPPRMIDIYSGIFALMAAFALIGAFGMAKMEGRPMRGRAAD